MRDLCARRMRLMLTRMLALYKVSRRRAVQFLRELVSYDGFY